MEQLDIFNFIYEKKKITKPIKLIELFAGIGSQAKALENLGANFTRHKVVEFDPAVIKSYNAVHGTSFEPIDITTIHAQDLDIRERERRVPRHLLLPMYRPLTRWEQKRNGKR